MSSLLLVSCYKARVTIENMTKTSKPFSYKEFSEIYSKVARLTVEVVIIQDNKVLLTKRKLPSWHDMWHIPGGTVLYKEKVADAIARVAKEEVGVKVEVEKILGYIEYPSEERERGFGWSVGMAFQCRIIEGNISPNEDSSDVQFFNPLPANTIPEPKEFLETTLPFLVTKL